MIPPILVKETDLPAPTGAPAFFLLASNGVFLVKEMDLYRACVEVKGVPGLLPHQESIQLKIPRLPRALVETCIGFFSTLYRRYQSEGVLLLFFSHTNGFHVEAPTQSVYRWASGRPCRRVDYENPPTPAGYSRLGTWHSHANLPAYHSHQDHLDEAGEDGLHVVVGAIDRGDPSFSFSFVVNGRRFFLREEDVIEGYDHPILPPPGKWMEQVTCFELWDGHHQAVWLGADGARGAGI